MDVDTNVSRQNIPILSVDLIRSLTAFPLLLVTETSLGSDTACSYYFSLASLFLVYFHSLSLSFMTLTFLKNTTLPLPY